MLEKSAGMVFGAEKLFDLLDRRRFGSERDEPVIMKA